MGIAQDKAMKQEGAVAHERVLRDLAVQFWPIDRLIPYARNARTHTEEQVAQVAASIVEFGWTNPILVGADRIIIAGHARLARQGGERATTTTGMVARGTGARHR